jgi:glucokinase
MSEYSIGLDLGGTNYRAAAIDPDGNLLLRVAGETRSPGGRDSVMDELVNAIQKLRNELGENRLTGIGIGVPGFILIEKGLIVGSNNLPYF